MVKKYEDVSLLIQGPVDISFDPTKIIPPNMFGEVIISTWESCAKNILYSEWKVVSQSDDIDPSLDVQYNMGKQALTVLKGLRACTKPYVLKMRTDEKVSNLDVLVNKFYDTGCTKWVCAPVVFLAPSQFKFHAADHLFIAPRERLIKTFQMTIGQMYLDTYQRNNNNEPAAEITFTHNYLVAGKFEPHEFFHYRLMKDNFDVVALEDLMPFSIKIGTKGLNFTTPEQVYNDMPFLRGVRTIEDMLSR